MVDPPCSEVNPSSLFPLPVLPDPARLQVPVADVRVEQVHREHRRVLKHLDRVGICILVLAIFFLVSAKAMPRFFCRTMLPVLSLGLSPFTMIVY